MRIAHLAAYGNQNAGDSALQYGLRRVLNEDWPEALEFTAMQVTNGLQHLDAIKQHDLCLIGGGGLISPAGTPSGFMVPFDFDQLKAITIPIIVYGIGHNLFAGDEINVRRVGRLRDIALAFSVRNDGSAERLGLDVDIVPDPGMWIEANDTKESYEIVLQLAANRTTGRMKDESRFLGSVQRLLRQLSKRYSVLAVSHIQKDDRYAVYCKRWGARVRPADHKRKLQNIRAFFGVYKNAKCVIAMRGHAQICAYGLNTPFYTIATQDKNTGFAEDVGYGDYIARAGEFDIEKIHRLVRDNGPKHRLDEYRKQARIYHKRLWGLLNA